jgi:hypothetical protein
MTKQETKIRNGVRIFKCTLFDMPVKIIIGYCHVKINRKCVLENPIIIFTVMLVNVNLKMHVTFLF